MSPFIMTFCISSCGWRKLSPDMECGCMYIDSWQKMDGLGTGQIIPHNKKEAYY